MVRVFSSEKEFVKWNEGMFLKHTNERCFTHPNPILRFVETQRLRALFKLCKIRDGDKVLEVGCGSGYILNLIPKGELYGTDISKAAIVWARKKLKGKKNVKRLSVEPGERMKFPDSFFDVVFCSEVIEHVADPSKLVEEIWRVAKPGARIVFTFPNESLINVAKQTVKKLGLYNVVLKGIPEHMEDEWHVTEFSLPLFKKIVKEKFSLRKKIQVPFPGFPLRYAALLRPKK